MTAPRDPGIISVADAAATTFDAVIIGSGFGASFVAERLIAAGQSVLMLERGDWVDRGPSSWEPSQIGPLSSHCSTEAPFYENDPRRRRIRTFFCVGGPSVFYGAVSLRFRLSDFAPDAAVLADSGAAWPWSYHDLLPSYQRVETLLGVVGDPAADPTRPPGPACYTGPAAPLERSAHRLTRAATRLGFRPFPLPLAINRAAGPSGACVSCPTCDGFACAIGAKNDLATRLLPALIGRGLGLLSGLIATRLAAGDGWIRHVEAIDRSTGRRVRFRGRQVILAAGALGSPQLILGSGLDRVSTAPAAVGAYLTRHVNSAVFGLFPGRQNRDRRHQKQIGIHDLYHDADGAKLGAIQQLPTPPADYLRAAVPALGWLASAILPRALGLLTIAEDQPREANRVRLDPGDVDRFGMPALLVDHRYSRRDRWADRRLVAASRRILGAAGAVVTYAHRVDTFSHALGTLRAGPDPDRAPVDAAGRFRGVANLWVADGSVLPRSGGVNPSLTIAAIGARIGAGIVTAADQDAEVYRAVG